MNVLLRAEGLMKTYGAGQSAVKALNSVSLEIRKGELLVILGSGGSGKSTLLNLPGPDGLPAEEHRLCFPILQSDRRIDRKGKRRLNGGAH